LGLKTLKNLSSAPFVPVLSLLAFAIGPSRRPAPRRFLTAPKGFPRRKG
jgi:hypothetical protein